MDYIKQLFQKQPKEEKPVINIDPKAERPVWNNSVRYIALVGMIFILMFFAYMIRGSLTLIVLAAMVAYLLNPIVRFLNKRIHVKRNLAIMLAYLFFLLSICIAVSFIIPRVTQAVRNFFAIDWPQVLSTVEKSIESIENDLEKIVINIGGFELDLTQPLTSVREWIHSLRSESINIESYIPDLAGTARQLLSISTNVFSQVITWMIMAITAIMASVYFCRDGHKLTGFIVGIFEEKYQPEINELIYRLKMVWSRYFAGELKLMLFIGLLTFILYFALGLRWALVLGIIAGFCEVVPNIGPILATIPAIISALIFGSQWFPLNNIVVAVLAVILAVIIQQTENIFIVPHIMGNALELHPVIILIGIITISSRLGFIGAIFAAPLIALAKEVLYFIIKKIKKEDPYPEIYPDNP